MGSTTIYYDFLSTVDSLPKLITFSWATTWTVADNHLRRYVFSSHTRSSIPKTFSFYGEITNVQVSTEYTGFMMNVCF